MAIMNTWIHFLSLFVSFACCAMVQLSPSNPRTDGVSIISNIREVSIVDGKWAVNVFSQRSWHFIMSIGNDFGFDDVYPSSIKITVNTHSIATNELLFGFTSDNAQYISLSVPLDNINRATSIYPNCSTSKPSNLGLGDIAARPAFKRNCDIAGGSCLNWKKMLPPHSQLNVEQLPISIILENNPKNGILSVYYSGFDEFKSFSQRCEFNSFPTSGGLKVYFAGNDPGQSFIVNSFDVEAFVTTPTPTIPPPTDKPTSNPIKAPTKNPTLNPTKNPTEKPTVKPEIVQPIASNPTTKVTLRPETTKQGIVQPIVSTLKPQTTTKITVQPSVKPETTKLVTSNPTKNPSVNPTLNPTKDPTAKPTLKPISTTKPTLATTANQANIPSAQPPNVLSPTPFPVSPLEPPVDTTIIFTTVNEQCAMPGESCNSQVKRAERCCNGLRKGPVKCVFNGTVSALDGTRYGKCCVKSDMIGCTVDSHCCDANYRCDDVGFCREVTDRLNVVGSLAKAMRNDKENEIRNNKVMHLNDGHLDGGKGKSVLSVSVIVSVGLALLLFSAAVVYGVTQYQISKIPKQEMVSSDDCDGDDENECNQMLKRVVKLDAEEELQRELGDLE